MQIRLKFLESDGSGDYARGGESVFFEKIAYNPPITVMDSYLVPLRIWGYTWHGRNYKAKHGFFGTYRSERKPEKTVFYIVMEEDYD